MSKLLFNNSIGKLYDDKIVIAKNKFYYDRILSMDIEEQNNKIVNVLFVLVAIFFLIVASIHTSDVLFFYGSLALCFVSLLISILYHSKQYFFILSLSIGDQLVFKIKSKNKEEAKVFLTLATEVKEEKFK